MIIPREFHVLETAHWLVNHRINSSLPGYLMIGARQQVSQLPELPSEALSELGLLLAMAEGALRDIFGAARVYSGRYGHSPGHTPHFHVIPIYGWVKDLFWKDERYRVLDGLAEGPGETATDGAQMTLFVWREFCEGKVPPPIEGPSVEDAISLLRAAMAQ